MAAGGHQGYAAVGGLFTQSRPLEAHLFGPISEQMKRVPVSSIEKKRLQNRFSMQFKVQLFHS